jgi:hypothetical protein
MFTISKPREKSLVSFNHRKKDNHLEHQVDKLELIKLKLSQKGVPNAGNDIEEFSKGLFLIIFRLLGDEEDE